MVHRLREMLLLHRHVAASERRLRHDWLDTTAYWYCTRVSALDVVSSTACLYSWDYKDSLPIFVEL